MATNYQDPNLQETAAKVYEVEAMTSQHYERMRTQITQFTLVATAALLGTEYKEFLSPIVTASVLILIAVFMTFASMELTRVHSFHCLLSIKMRAIMLRRHNKTWRKFSLVHRIDRRAKRKLPNIDKMWCWAVALPPTLAAVYILISRFLFENKHVTFDHCFIDFT